MKTILILLGITCLQCTPVQLEVLRRTGAMPVSSRRCGLITKREAERLVKSFLEEIPPPKLPDNFSFNIFHKCGWGCQGEFIPSRYNSSRAKCIKCTYCGTFYSPNKFIFHYHKTQASSYRHPDAANFNSWRRHIYLADVDQPEALQYAWEDVKSMFNGGCRKKIGSVGVKLPSPTTSLHHFKAELDFDATAPIPTQLAIQHPSSLNNMNLDRSHPAFQPHNTHNIESYGDMLRSLSMHYSPWLKPWYFQRNQSVPSSFLPPEVAGVSTLNIPRHCSSMQSSPYSTDLQTAGGTNVLKINMNDLAEDCSFKFQDTKKSTITEGFNIASLIGKSNNNVNTSTKLKIPKLPTKSETNPSIKNVSNREERDSLRSETTFEPMKKKQRQGIEQFEATDFSQVFNS